MTNQIRRGSESKEFGNNKMKKHGQRKENKTRK